jgi:heparosan-N-sulfate-glucuronate 5-epimerase
MKISFITLIVILLLSTLSTILLPSGVHADYVPPTINYTSDGMPLVYYGHDLGYQINPLTSSRKLISYHDNYMLTGNLQDLQYMKNIANWIVANAKHHGNYAVLEYEFPYKYNMTVPWRSAMAQAFAMHGLLDAYQVTNNYTYFDTAKLILNSFYVDVKDGGVTEKTDNQGWWYELYADEGGKNPKVLNGMLFTVLELHDYYMHTRDSKAAFLFEQGVLALKNNLTTYDGNGHSYYDSLKTIAFPFYHQLHIDLLNKLYQITSEPIFQKYRDKWILYQSESIPDSPSALRNSIYYIQLDAHTITSGDVTQTFKNPKWIENIAKWRAAGQINDSDFVQGIQYLIEKGIVYIDTANNAVSQIGLETDQNTFEITKDGITIITISGEIEDYEIGAPVIIKITKPDHTYHELTIFAKSNNEFTTQLLLGKDSITGTYVIDVMYHEKRISTAIFDLVKNYDW